MIGELSPLHWMVVIGVFMLLFGAKRMPDAARSLGRSMRILKAELGAEDATAPAATASAATTSPAAVPARAHTAPTYTAPTYTAPTVAAPPATATTAAHPEPTTA